MRTFLVGIIASSVLVSGCGDDSSDGGSGGNATGGTSTGGSSTGGTSTGGMPVGGGGSSNGGGGSSNGGGGMGGMAMGGGGSSMGGGGTGGMGPTVDIDFTINDALSTNPASGVEICDHANAQNCVTTNAMGQATITLPDADVTVEYSSALYRTHLINLRQGGTTQVSTVAVSDLVVNLTLSQAPLMTTDNQTKGHVIGVVDGDPSNAGAVVTLSPLSGTGVVYIDDTTGAPMNGMTDAGGAYAAFNVDPGTPEVAANLAGSTCTGSFGFTGSTANAQQVTVEAGAITIVPEFNCQ